MTELWFARYCICTGEKYPQGTQVKDRKAYVSDLPLQYTDLQSHFISANYTFFIRRPNLCSGSKKQRRINS